ncbi:MAG: LAGLIDADG family homing endonuclease [Patescibacteria group bacterium]
MGIKYKVNEEFFDKWNEEMAYILGYIYADGSIEDASYLRGKYIRVTSTDKITIKNIKRLLKSEHTIVKKPAFENNKEAFLLRIGSHKLYSSLTKLGVYPNKSLTVDFPKKIPSKYLKDFIRGYFDGDGCVHIEKTTNNKNKVILKRIRIIFSCGSKKFLKGLSDALSSKTKIINNIHKNGNSFQLKYSTKDTIILFKFMYKNVKDKIFLKRKLDVFNEYFELKQKRVDKEVYSVLEYVNGHVVK